MGYLAIVNKSLDVNFSHIWTKPELSSFTPFLLQEYLRNNEVRMKTLIYGGVFDSASQLNE